MHPWSEGPAQCQQSRPAASEEDKGKGQREHASPSSGQSQTLTAGSTHFPWAHSLGHTQLGDLGLAACVLRGRGWFPFDDTRIPTDRIHLILKLTLSVCNFPAHHNVGEIYDFVCHCVSTQPCKLTTAGCFIVCVHDLFIVH